MPYFDVELLSRVEDAGLNASAPPQQRWIDGWLVRYSPGKARRARCINAVAQGRLPLRERLALARAVYEAAQVPMVVRITRFTQPPDLDAALADMGWTAVDDTQVMLCPALPAHPPSALPDGLAVTQMGAEEFAHTVGALRDTPPPQRQAHAQRLANVPVPHQAFVLKRTSEGSVLACGQFAIEAELVGLYDVFTHEQHRGQGWATMLCQHMLTTAAAAGARTAYLQVSADNHPARKIYQRLGFADAYGYHYRQPEAAA